MWLHQNLNIILVASEKTLHPKFGARGAVKGGGLLAVKGVKKTLAQGENGSDSFLQTCEQAQNVRIGHLG